LPNSPSTAASSHMFAALELPKILHKHTADVLVFGVVSAVHKFKVESSYTDSLTITMDRSL
jgi:hypothetical protein